MFSWSISRVLGWTCKILSKHGPKAVVVSIYILTFIKTAQYAPDGWPFFPWLKNNYWWQCLILLVFLAVLPPMTWMARLYLRWQYGQNGENPAIKGILNAIQEKLSITTVLPHTYRVTLFKNHGDRWLKKYERNGLRTLSSRTKFRINPNNESKNEGIAGRCWYRSEVLAQSNLPDVSKTNVSDVDCVAYAERTFYDVKKVRKIKPRSRSLAGIPIIVNGKAWGALVFDSEDPEAIDLNITRQSAVRILLKAITLALQEVANALETG
jgi:hypothetical protein